MKSPVPIYDCHGHLGAHPDFPSVKYSADEMIQVMDLLGIEVLAITSTLACYSDCPRGNAEVAAVVKQYPKRFRGYVTVNPNPEGEALRELVRWNYFHRPPLIKFHPDLHKYPVNGHKYRPAWDYANQTRAVVLVHTWDSDPNCGPLLLAPIAREFPHARILAGALGSDRAAATSNPWSRPKQHPILFWILPGRKATAPSLSARWRQSARIACSLDLTCPFWKRRCHWGGSWQPASRMQTKN